MIPAGLKFIWEMSAPAGKRMCCAIVIATILLSCAADPGVPVRTDSDDVARGSSPSLQPACAGRVVDVVYLIDASDSASAPSGWDVDGDGKLGRDPSLGVPFLDMLLTLLTRDTGDSIFQLQVRALQNLLEDLQFGNGRVGVLTYGDDWDPDTAEVEVVSPLTNHREELLADLERLRRTNPGGRTNTTAAINVATVELLGTASATSRSRQDAEKIIVLIGDGIPTEPFGNRHLAQNRRSAIEAASRAGKLGVRIDTLLTGGSDDPTLALVFSKEVASETGGLAWGFAQRTLGLSLISFPCPF